VKVMLHAIFGLKDVIGGRDVEMEIPEGTTVQGLLDRMVSRWGDGLSPHLFEPGSRVLIPHLRVMVNGQTIAFLQGTETPLKEGDDVLFLPIAAGG
jgi:MoaD family protein